MPSYRISGLVMAHLHEKMTDEQRATLEVTLIQADESPHPFHTYIFQPLIDAIFSAYTKKKPVTSVEESKSDKPIPSNLPIEEQKRREAAAAGKPFRVPEWWQGERNAYNTAKSLMGILPKKIGGEVR